MKIEPWMWATAAAVVGTGIWYWTRKPAKSGNSFQGTTRLPTQNSVGFALLSLGYPTSVGTPGWTLKDAQTVTQVQSFQRDYNRVREVVRDTYGLQLGTTDLRTDGVVDRATIQAIENAMHLVEVNEDTLGTWPEVVQDALHPQDADEPTNVEG